MEEKETKKTVRIFAFASFLNDLGSDMIYPVWPLFVTTVLGASMTVLGFIDGLGDVVVSLSQAASGYLSDRLGKRKVFIWTGYMFGSLSRLGYAVSTTWAHLIPFRVLDRAGKIRAAPRDAIIADISTRENRGKHFGLLRMMDNLGAACGVVACVLLLGALGYRRLFFLAALPSAVGVLLILKLIKESKPPARAGGAERPTPKPFSLKLFDRNMRLFLLISVLFALGSFSYSFLLLGANKLGFRATFLPVLYLIFTLVASISSLPFGNLSDRLGRKAILALAFAFWGFVCLAFMSFPRLHGQGSRAAIIGAFVLYGLHKGALEPVQKTFVAELCPPELRASSLGGFQMAVGLCALPASFIAGLLWDRVGIIMPFAFSLSLTVLSIVMLAFVREK
jgi:MFS family permease